MCFVLLLVQEERRAQLPRYQRLIPPHPVATAAPPTAAVGTLPPQQPPIRHPMHSESLLYQIKSKHTPLYISVPTVHVMSMLCLLQNNVPGKMHLQF